MKNILVPTDYSDNARNAAEYAIQLARATGASIEFLHVFPEPENVEEQEDIQQFKDLLKKEKTILTCEAKNFNTKFGIKIKTTVYPGKLHEVLKTMMFNQSADLVVVGMKGISVIDKIFWGSTTTKLLQHATFPLLIIPSEKQFTPLKHVTFAADYNSLLGEKSFSILKNLINPFKGKTEIVHIDQSEEDSTEFVEKYETEKYFRRAFEGIKHSYTILEEDNVIVGLNNFIKSKKSDMVVMIPQKHNVLQKIFIGRLQKKWHIRQMFHC